MALILVMSGPNDGDYHPLSEQPVVIGRHEDCTLQILDRMVSRRHIEVTASEPGRFCVRCLQTTNGTQVNNRAIDSESPLMDGDVISIGETMLLFVDQDLPQDEDGLNRLRRRGERRRSTILGQ